MSSAPATKKEARYVAQFEKYLAGKGRFPQPRGIPTLRTHELIHYAQDRAGAPRSVFQITPEKWHAHNDEACRSDSLHWGEPEECAHEWQYNMIHYSRRCPRCNTLQAIIP
jgi:hypothetical protein